MGVKSGVYGTWRPSGNSYLVAVANEKGESLLDDRFWASNGSLLAELNALSPNVLRAEQAGTQNNGLVRVFYTMEQDGKDNAPNCLNMLTLELEVRAAQAAGLTKVYGTDDVALGRYDGRYKSHKAVGATFAALRDRVESLGKALRETIKAEEVGRLDEALARIKARLDEVEAAMKQGGKAAASTQNQSTAIKTHMAWSFNGLLGERDGDKRPQKNYAFDNEKILDMPAPEEDYQAILASSIVRALQDKTQMLALDTTAQSRTRLTHSFEVSAITLRLVDAVSKILKEWEKAGTYHKGHYLKDYFVPDDSDEFASMRWAIQAAGLLHDLGNPPFGHEGEDKLSEKVREWCERHPGEDFLSQGERNDLKRVEGNSQGLRYLLNPNPAMGSTLRGDAICDDIIGSMLKYTIPSKDWTEKDSKLKDKEGSDSKGLDDEKYPVWEHKPGCYLSEFREVKRLQDNLGIRTSAESTRARVRHPLAYLLEAADDIAYLTSDFEDAFNAGHITPDNVRDMWELPPSRWRERDSAKWEGRDPRIVKKDRWNPDSSTKSKSLKELQTGLAQPIRIFRDLNRSLQGATNDVGRQDAVRRFVQEERRTLVYAAAEQFSYHLDEIMTGKFHEELLKSSDMTKDFKQAMGDAMKCFVYKNEEVGEQRLRGEDALGSIFDWLSSYIDGSTGMFQGYEDDSLPTELHEELCDHLRGYMESTSYEGRQHPAYYSMRTILDYISSLTDRHVMELAEVLDKAKSPSGPSVGE